jgi:hypothetical protein
MIGVTGWFSANACSQLGIDSVGTNALLTYGRNRNPNVNPFAASGVWASSPSAADTQEIARTNSDTRPITPSHSNAPAFGRKPMSRPTPTTTTAAPRLRRRLATT